MTQMQNLRRIAMLQSIPFARNNITSQRNAQTSQRASIHSHFRGTVAAVFTKPAAIVVIARFPRLFTSHRLGGGVDDGSGKLSQHVTVITGAGVEN
jgi:hypothetical protein